MPTLKMLAVDEVLLDVGNPRIARVLEKYGDNPNAEQINLALGGGSPSSLDGDKSGTTFQSLKESIRTNGGVINPIIVNRRPDGVYVVIEGNTRVAIYRDFKRQNLQGDWNLIPALVHDNLDLSDQDAIRLQAHLVGPRQWDPYSKAKYLNYLRNCEHLSLNKVIDFCGGRKPEVLSYIDAYNDMETYYRPILEDESDFDPTRFSAFVELQKQRVQQAIVSAGYDKEAFSRWVDERLIDPLATVRDLPRILDNKRSREKFLHEGAKEALKELVLHEGGNLADASMDSLVNELTNRLRSISFATVREMSSDPEGEKARNIISLKNEIDQICQGIEAGID